MGNKVRLASVVFSSDVQLDVHKTVLSDGSFMFCVWIKKAGQQGTAMQANHSLTNQSGASFGEVSSN